MSGGAGQGLDVLAEAWPGLKARITLGQAKALLSAAQWAGMSARDLATMGAQVAGAETPDQLMPDGWADMMDHFVALGFRHPLVPMVTAVQLAALDEARRRIGLDGRQFVAMVRQFGGVRARRRLDGAGFLAVMERLARAGSGVAVPDHGTMTRPLMRLLHEAAYQKAMTAAELRSVFVPLGGVLRPAQLDRRGFLRTMHVLFRGGAVPYLPAPVVAASAGMVTQAQVNLIWRLWQDIGGWKGDTTPAALDRAIGSLLGMEGGLASLTRAGARIVIDRFMVPRLNDRRRDRRSLRKETIAFSPSSESPSHSGDAKRDGRAGDTLLPEGTS